MIAIIPANDHTWNEITLKHWQHTSEFAQLQTANHRLAERYIIQEQNITIGYFLIVTYTLWRDKTICYLPYGPIWLNKPSPDHEEGLSLWLQDYGKRQRAVCARLESFSTPPKTSHLPLFAYRSSFHQPRGEAVMTLDKMDVLESRFSKNTKRNLKKAGTNNLTISFAHGHDMIQHIPDFIRLNRENTNDHHTTTHPDQYFETLFTILAQNHNNFISIVRQEDSLLAINVFVIFGTEAYCPFGASNKTGKELGAYYWIKRQSIEHLVALGVTTFNWGGIAVGKNDDNLRGLNQFKLGWGTKEKHHGDFYDVVVSPFWYYLYLLRGLFKK